MLNIIALGLVTLEKIVKVPLYISNSDLVTPLAGPFWPPGNYLKIFVAVQWAISLAKHLSHTACELKEDLLRPRMMIVTNFLEDLYVMPHIYQISRPCAV